MRYAFNGVPYEKDGNFLQLLRRRARAAVPPTQVLHLYLCRPRHRPQLYADSWKLIEPRVGFAYDLGGDGKTAIRGGFGIFHDRVFDNLFGNAKSNPPFQAQVNDYPFDGTIHTPTASNTPPPGTLTRRRASRTARSTEPVVIDPNLKMPTNETYNLGIQHQFGRVTLETKLRWQPRDARPSGDRRSTAPTRSRAGLLASGVAPAALQRDALYNTYAATYNTAFVHELFQTSGGGSDYNGLQFKATGQLGGLNLTGSYTYSHSLDDSSDALAPGAGTAAYRGTALIWARSTVTRRSMLRTGERWRPAMTCQSAAVAGSFRMGCSVTSLKGSRSPAFTGTEWASVRSARHGRQSPYWPE